MAATRRAPRRRAIHHSGRGAACTSPAFSQRITEPGLHQSPGKTGDCYGNAAAEACFATLKRELAWIHHTGRWSTKDQLRTALSGYIEDFYNPQRIQHRPGHQSPIDFDRAVS
jgi:transposase InsO family protein